MPYKPTIPTICANVECGIEFLAARPSAGRQPTKYHTAACAIEGLSTPLEYKYWQRVIKTDGCWGWTGMTAAFGYGLIGHRGKLLYAHRVSWELHFGGHPCIRGPIPEGIEVCHHCDNPPCTRPSHLFMGDHAANLHDAQVKGRLRQPGLSGSAHPQAKLTESDIPIIKALRLEGLLQREIAQQFGVTRAMIGYILRGQNWTSA
jgi:hypothetical protein